MNGFKKQKKINKQLIITKSLYKKDFEEILKVSCNTKNSYLYLFKKVTNRNKKDIKTPKDIINFYKNNYKYKRIKLYPNLYKSLKDNNYIIKKGIYMHWLNNLWEMGEEIKYTEKIIYGDFRGISISLDINNSYKDMNIYKREELKKYPEYIIVGNKEGKECF